MLNHYIAETGKVFKSKVTNDVLGRELYLGKNDTLDNYEQVDEVVRTDEEIIVEDEQK